MKEKEKHVRSMVKTITWRVIASITTFVLVYVFTGEIELSIGVGIFDVILKLIFYFGHERLWNEIKWGRKEVNKSKA